MADATDTLNSSPEQPEISHTALADAAGQTAAPARDPADTLERVDGALLLLEDHELSELKGAADAAAQLAFHVEEETPHAKGLCWLARHVVERVEALEAAIDEARDIIGRRPSVAVVLQEAEERRLQHEREAADYAAATMPAPAAA